MDCQNTDLLRFISGYNCPEKPQQIEDIKGDFQLAGLMTALNKSILSTQTTLIVDIGCGNGVLLAKLSEIDCFKKCPTLQYEGYDLPFQLPKAFENATKLKLLSRVKFNTLDEDWSLRLKDNCIVVIRNVLHELNLAEISKLFYILCMNLPSNASVFIQDMTTLPVAEKNRCGWIGTHIESVLQSCGMNTFFTPDISKRGVDIFLIEGKMTCACNKTESEIKDMLLHARNEQLKILKLKYKQLEELPHSDLPFLRLNHDITSIILQMGQQLDSTENDDIISSLFSLAFKNLSIHDYNNLRLNYKYPQVKWFQDRGHTIQAIDEFLLSNKSIMHIIGPSNIGKKTVVWEALDKKQHNRLPLYIDFFTGISVFYILESIATQLGIARFLDIEILNVLKTYPTEKLFIAVKDIVKTTAMNTILILSSFENIIDPSHTINSLGIKEFIDQWSSVKGAKIIIESKCSIKDFSSDICQIEFVSVFKSRDDSPRFGTYLYSVQLLQEIIPNEYRLQNSEYGGFPLELLKNLDNHPYFLYLAATAIKNNQDIKCLSNPAFIKSITYEIADTLIKNSNLTDNEIEFLYALTLINDGFPLCLIDNISDDPLLAKKIIEKGLIIKASDVSYKAISVLKFIDNSLKEKYTNNLIEVKWNKIFCETFNQLYKITSSPIYYRQAQYHAILSGEKILVSAYNISEISNCTEIWYKKGYRQDALWGYQEIKKVRKLFPRELMNEASCLLRTGRIIEGKEAYIRLIGQFPDWHGLRSSFIDSLISSGKCSEEALEKLNLIDDAHRDYYWHRQVARCYKQLNRRANSYCEYEKALNSTYARYVHSIIYELINYAVDSNDIEYIEMFISNYAHWSYHCISLIESIVGSRQCSHEIFEHLKLLLEKVKKFNENDDSLI